MMIRLLLAFLMCLPSLAQAHSDPPTKTTRKRTATAADNTVIGATAAAGCPNCIRITKKRGSGRPASSDTQRGAPFLSIPAQEHTSQGTLPTPDQVIETFIRATGGREAYLKIKTQRATGTVEVPAMTDGGSLEMYAKAPNKSLVVMNLGRLGEVKEGFNGRRGWNQSRQTGVRFSTPAKQAALKRDADFYKYLNFKEHFPRAKVVGAENAGGVDAYVIEATPAGGGTPEKMYFDTRTGLLIRLDVVRDGVRTRNIPSTAYYGDYREVDGVKMPFHIQQTVGNVTFVLQLSEVKSNVLIDDAVFNPPRGR